jgi:hypothetical protein
MAYVMHKQPYVFPICGGRKLEHPNGNIEALGLDMDKIDGAAPFERGFPFRMTGARVEDCWQMNLRGHFNYVPRPQVLRLGQH